MFTPITNKPFFRYNPFQGLTPYEIHQVIRPRPETSMIMDTIQNNQSMIIQLYGKKGRGKTTHLTYLHQLFPYYPFYRLDTNFDFKIPDTKVLFIDSIHHLTFRQRLHLYQNIPTIILSTHHHRWFEFKLAKRFYQTVYFRGLQLTDLITILNQRIELAVDKKEKDFVKIQPLLAAQFLKKYGDDLRGIINHLYDQFEEQYG